LSKTAQPIKAQTADFTAVNTFSARLKAFQWLGVFMATGVLLALLFIDSHQQDGGYHFLFARWGWKHPVFFVGVWSRPLFTFLYSFPAHFGYLPAKLFTVALSAVAAWQTMRVAEHLGIKRPQLVIPLMLVQPSLFLIFSDTMTEPLFAVIFIIALRLHLRGYVKAGMLVASAMLLARPEGFFIGVLWGFWVLLDSRDRRAIWRRLPSTLMLATGGFVWWLAAYLITRDPLYIKTNWPRDWKAVGSVYGDGPIWSYVARAPEIIGPILLVPFVIGLGLLLVRRQLVTVTSSFLALLILHSVFRAFGMFGSAGYPRYFVCVAPAIALITLAGWNAIGDALLTKIRIPKLPVAVLAGLVLSGSWYLSFLYMDAAAWSRDAHAIAEMHAWFLDHPRPITKFAWSQAFMPIIFDTDVGDKFYFSPDREQNLVLLREAPKGTLVLWDGQTGPSWYGIKGADIEAAGYTRLRSRNYTLQGYIVKQTWFGFGGPREQEMHLLYKE
jgi:hypothetical protein